MAKCRGLHCDGCRGGKSLGLLVLAVVVVLAALPVIIRVLVIAAYAVAGLVGLAALAALAYAAFRIHRQLAYRRVVAGRRLTVPAVQVAARPIEVPGGWVTTVSRPGALNRQAARPGALPLEGAFIVSKPVYACPVCGRFPSNSVLCHGGR